MQLKYGRETQDDLVKRLIAEWEDLKEYRLDMDIVLRLKDKQIESLQKEFQDINLKQHQQTFISTIKILPYFYKYIKNIEFF
jgi:prefoldin subunit 5